MADTEADLDPATHIVWETGGSATVMGRLLSDARLKGRPYARMNGVGNAILVVDMRGTDLIITADEARRLAQLPGFIFDQLMAIHDGKAGDGADAFVRIYNTDGSPSGACGNGTRCVAWFLMRDRVGDDLLLTTDGGTLACRRIGPWQFSVDLGAPRFGWAEVPLRDAVDPRTVDVGAEAPGTAFTLSMGNPHAVFFVPDVASVDLARIGPPIEHAAIFPERANVSFAQIIDRASIKLRVWERGAGATLGCGTGACAALVAAAATGRTGRRAAVDLPGGRLEIVWGEDDHVIMSGPVELEAEGLLDGGLFADRAA